MSVSIGVRGIGAFIPPLRDNAWWPASVVASWAGPVGPPPVASSDGARITMQMMQRTFADPFRGGVTRGVMPASMCVADMEESAARDALACSGVDASDVDFVLCSNSKPINEIPASPFDLHARLGLTPRVLSATVDAENNSFLTQLVLASALITSGRRCGLLVQSSQRARLIEAHSPFSPLFGDGATATIVTQGDDAIVHHEHATDSHRRDAYTMRADPNTGAMLTPGPSLGVHFLEVVELIGLLAERVLAAAALAPSDLASLITHQPTAWFGDAVAQRLGATGALARETFSKYGSVGACNIPLALTLQPDLRKAGTVSMLAGGGAGRTWSCMLLRWSTIG